jgi:uncharacterized protein with beta-barrel porin domain
MATSNRVFLVSLLLSAIASPAMAGAPVPWPDDVDPRYVYAVSSSSASLTQEDVVTNLTTIGTASGSTDHIRNSSGQILMTMFTDYNNSGVLGYDRSYIDKSPGVGRSLWATVAPELQTFLRDHDVSAADTLLRIKQLLGLPETHKGYYVVEFWTDTANLFRPAMNPDLTNSTTSLVFQGAMADPGSAERLWFNSTSTTTYDANQGMPYPWTRAGYTYDWGNPTSNVGLSEFIFNGGTVAEKLTVRAVFSPTSYRYYQRDSESFDITGACQTVWIGSNYIPNTLNGNDIVNTVTIHSGATVSGGEGIVVTDLFSGTSPSNVLIDNAGTIQGAGTRTSSVWLTNTGGTVNNSGTITGDPIGILAPSTTRSVVVSNTGTIRGSVFSIFTDQGNDTITSSGLLDGAVYTGGGNDVVNILGGTVTGDIDGGLGSNTLNFSPAAGSIFRYDAGIYNFDTIVIHSGTVRLNGNVGGSVTVEPGATLGGNATITGSLTNEGIVAPGNSVGTISAAGYSQSSGAVLEIEIAKSASGVLNGDRLLVSGTASLAAGSMIHVTPEVAASRRVFATGDTFQFLTAASGVVDDGAQPTLDSQFLGLSGVAGAGGYTFTLNRTATFTSAAAPGNNRAMAAALDADTGVAADGYALLVNELLLTDTATFNGLLQRYSPAAYLDVSAASNRTTQYMAESLGQYLRTRRLGRQTWCGSPTLARAGDSPTELADVIHRCCYEEDGGGRPRGYNPDYVAWATAFGVFYGEKTSGDHLGFQSNVAGSQFGIDKQFSEDFIAGFGGGYDQMHIATNDNYSFGETETFRIGPYATWFGEAWYLDASVTGGFHDNSLSRSVSVADDVFAADGRYHADDLSIYLGGGRDYHVGSSVITPQASLQYIVYRQNDFTETNGDGAALAVDPLDVYSLRSRVGGQFLRVFQYDRLRVLLDVAAGWAHEYLENDTLEARFVGGLTRFGTDRGGIFRDSGYYNISLAALPRNHVSLFTRYSGEYASGGHYTAVDAGLMFEF